jgi:hypothetical protein
VSFGCKSLSSEEKRSAADTPFVPGRPPIAASEPISEGCPGDDEFVVWMRIESAVGDQPLRKIVGEL